MRIEEIDPNFKTESAMGLDDVVFLNVRRDPFRVYGLYDYRHTAEFRRLPDAVAASVNPGVRQLAENTAGGRVRFATDSPYIALRCRWKGPGLFSHMTLCARCGFDLYRHEAGAIGGRDTYVGTFMPPADLSAIREGYSAVLRVPGGKMTSYTVHFPLYNGVTDLEIGVQSTSSAAPGADYAPVPPIVFYGSSITQGGCASRPGNCYPNIISARLNADHLNLGFSGSARGEKEMADYIADLPMSVFVLDYDHNAPSPAYLEATHEAFFRTVREKQPTLPILIVSRPDPFSSPDALARREIVFRTCSHALAAGDRNVVFIDGLSILGMDYRDCGTVDGTHPNDFGFVRMAQVIGYEIEKMLRK